MEAGFATIIAGVTFSILYHATTMLYRLHRRRKYEKRLYMYFNRLLNLYCADTDKSKIDYWRLRYDIGDNIDYWILTHNIDFYMREYRWSYSTIANPLIAGQGDVYMRGLPAKRLIQIILKDCSDIDFGKYIDKAVAKDFQYPEIRD